MGKIKEDLRPLGSTTSWAKTPGTYIAAQAAIDGADHAALTMEQKWGAGRLRFLVSVELREKFDRQRYLFNQAIWHGDLETVRRESSRMTTAWQALDKAASDARRAPLLDGVWEVVLEDGTVAAITQGATPVLQIDGRKVVVYTLEEIGRLLSHYPEIAKVKQSFPGAEITAVRRPFDPLDAIHDSKVGLDEPINDFIPNLGI